jgi:hypothetical protein
MIYKISPGPSFPKRGKDREALAKEKEERELFIKKGKEKPKITHSITRRGIKINKKFVNNNKYVTIKVKLVLKKIG